MNYVIATIKNWNIEEYHARKNSMTGNPKLITDKQQLNKDFLKKIKPKYIFFPHWSWNVPSDILNEYECICFHMTDLPYGRGGSPLQNLIVNNKKKTVISALRMEKQIDAGPVYLKKPLMLDGKAQDIYKNSSKIIFNMIESMLQKVIVPKKQLGKVTKFKRRTAKQSKMPKNKSLIKVYDHIRMLDADTYPKAFINYGNLNLQFSNANKKNNEITATATIIIRENENENENEKEK